ncbi:SMP-30/gluconolactonase/LRE family protein [Pseudonocardia yuanmonensis]|uniref:SMP-30/gluconolactonase/LRE family protein n=1 Tax=Pseudonocardia yuanmonensis TaxID=1095914 RepID=A0ABP8XQ31_9PSEU
MRELTAEPVTGPVAHHGEGPVWHPSWAGVRWVDMLAGDILELAGGEVRRTHVGDVAAAFRPRRGGGVVLAAERNLLLLDDDLRCERDLGPVWSDPGVRFNDGGCTPDGAFWCGTMAYDERPGAGTLFRLGPDLAVEPVLAGVTVSNGFCPDPTGTRVYYIDTPTGRIDVFDLDAGPTARRPFAGVTGGHPDGLTVDAEGGVWVALWEGSAVHRYTPDGRLDARVPLPVSRVTACTFGGPGLDTLYVTTSAEGADRGAEPLAGALFALTPGVRGLPVLEFAG